MTPSKSAIRTPLGVLAELVIGRPRLIVAVSLFLAVLSGLYAALDLEIRMGRNDLLSADLPYNIRYRQFTEEFSSLEGGVAVIEADDPGAAAAFAEDLADDLAPRLGERASIQYKIADPALLRKGALLLPRRDLERIARAVETAAPLLRGALRPEGLEALFDGLADRIAEADEEEDLPREGIPVLSGLLDGLRARIAGEPGAGPLLPDPAPAEEAYFWSDDRRFLFALIDPYPEEDTDLTRIVRDSLDRVRARHPDVRAGLTGRPVLAQDEMESATRDMIIATVVSVVAVALLFIASFRGLLLPALGMITLIGGITVSFGAATAVIGHLNLLSVVFGAILVGLGVDFGIHLLSRYEEERLRGASPPGAIRTGLMETGGGIVTGALTTACAFFAIAFGTFRGIGEMGIISGMGILICLGAMLLLFPALLVLFDRKEPRGGRGARTVPDALIRLYRRPGPLIVLAVIVTAGAGALTLTLRFNYNLLELQVQDLESVRYEKKLIAGEGMTTWFCASLADSLEEARRRARAFEELPEVRKVDGLHRLIPEGQAELIDLLYPLRSLLEEVASASPPLPVVRPDEILSALDDVIAELEAAQEVAFEAGDTDAIEALDGLIDDASSLADAIGAARGEPQRIGRVQQALQQAIIDAGREGLRYIPESPVTIEDIPPALRSRYLGDQGHFLLMVFPEGDIWGRESKERFVQAVREVDPEVTGSPVQVYESVGIMRRGYEKAGLLALAVVFGVILIDFRSLRSAILAIAPLIMGAIWMAGSMVPLGLEFNNANLLVLPLVLGIGIVNGVHIMHRYREAPTAIVDIVWGSTGKGIVLTAFTTIAGCLSIGLIAEHPGLSSLGNVLSLGVFTCLLSTFLALPPLMQIFFRTARRASRRRGRDLRSLRG